MGNWELTPVQFEVMIANCRSLCQLIDRVGDVSGWREYGENPDSRVGETS